ncbi:nuclear transport factor 2 family protein [Candidatus Leptofilum sp.]|uniref:nuclear transport factor 2 family protein n=1 Tax=Candidatus Leptofilum sp. TaxID=3241576 RepID=UPI003B5C1583
MNPEIFIEKYEAALASQDWQQVDPLVHPEACVTFSSGAVHIGKTAVRQALERNFSLIQDETYKMENVHWVKKAAETAVYLFTFHWSGLINGEPASGAGTGTAVLIKTEDKWQLLVEHLGPKAT